MKTKSSRCQFQLKIMYGQVHYIAQVAKLEAAIRRKPRTLQLNMIGTGEIPPDWALLIRSILLKRFPKTKLITNARSSLQDGAVLVWLMGDQRIIRDDARLFFKRNPLADEEPVEVYAGLGASEPKYKDSFSSLDPEDADYERVLKLIDEFLPVNEFAGKVVSVDVLREFGIVENKRMDNLLASSFSKSERAFAFN
jgi:hypothetical protein